MDGGAKLMLRGFFIAALLVFSAAAYADTPKTWGDIDTNLRTELQVFKGVWKDIPNPRKQKILQRAKDWPSLNSQDRAKTKQRWQRLANKMRKFKTLTPAEKAKARDGWKKFQSLPPEKRKALRKRWKNMSDAERDAALRELSR